MHFPHVLSVVIKSEVEIDALRALNSLRFERLPEDALRNECESLQSTTNADTLEEQVGNTFTVVLGAQIGDNLATRECLLSSTVEEASFVADGKTNSLIAETNMLEERIEADARLARVAREDNDGLHAYHVLNHLDKIIIQLIESRHAALRKTSSPHGRRLVEIDNLQRTGERSEVLEEVRHRLAVRAGLRGSDSRRSLEDGLLGDHHVKVRNWLEAIFLVGSSRVHESRWNTSEGQPGHLRLVVEELFDLRDCNQRHDVRVAVGYGVLVLVQLLCG